MKKTSNFPWVAVGRIGCTLTSWSMIGVLSIVGIFWVLTLFLPLTQIPLLMGNVHMTINELKISLKDITADSQIKLISSIIFLGASLFGIYYFYLFRLLRSLMVLVEDSLQFTSRIVQKTKRIGWILILGGIVGPSLGAGFLYLLNLQGLTLDIKLDLLSNSWMILTGILVRTMADLFQHGFALQKEMDATV